MKFAVLYLIITFALSQIKIVFKSKAEKDRNVRWLLNSITNINSMLFMRNFKLFVLLVFLGLATSALAESFDSGSFGYSSAPASSRNSNSVFSKRTNGWNRVFISYLPTSVKWDDGYDNENYKFQGFQVGWLKGFSLSPSIPLYLEGGVALQYRSYTDEDSDFDGHDRYGYSDKYRMLSVNLPINVLYRFNFTDDFSLSPYSGFDFRTNVLAKNKYEEWDNDQRDSGDSSMFDEDEWGSDAWNRFQVGWHIGVGVDYRMLHCDMEYGVDFNDLAKYAHLSTFAITFGFNF